VEELDRRQRTVRQRDLVILRELEADLPRVMVDAEQLRFAVGALFDCALRMMPRGADLYVGNLHHPEDAEQTAGHRLLIRFHSPEDAVIDPDGVEPLEVVLARSLIERMGGALDVDAASAEDNLFLVELPA